MASKASSSSQSPFSSSSSSSSSSARRCLCSPTTHPGSFRCSFHRSSRKLSGRSTAHINRLDSSKMVMSKASVLKAFLMQIIKPSSHDLQRKRNFLPKPTRFAVLNTSGNGVAVS